MAETLNNLAAFQGPDFGIKGNPINEFRSYSKSNSSPGKAAHTDFLGNAFGDHKEKNQPVREDDGKSGRRVAKVIYYEYLSVDLIYDPIVATMVKGSGIGDLTDEVLVVYAAPAGGSTSMLPTPEETMGPNVDLTRIYRFPKFYSISRNHVAQGQDCIIEFASTDVHYGIFHGMVDEDKNMMISELGGHGRSGAPDSSARGGLAGAFRRSAPGMVGSYGSNSGLSKSEMTPAMLAAESGPKKKLVRVEADKVSGYDGYKSMRLNADVAVKYNQLRKRALELGGVITSAGGLRSLTQKTNSSRSALSLHYIGRAFDLALPTGMNNPKRDPYVCVRDPNNSRRFIVWCRTANPSISTVTLPAEKVVSSRGRTAITIEEVTDRFFNFTELASRFGFKGIQGRKSFFRGGKYTGAEWWHFQNTDGLVHSQTTFGQELLSIYSLEKVKQEFTYWAQSAGKLYGSQWA